MSDFLKLFGENISKDMPGFVALSVIDVKSGNLYYSKNNSKNFNLEIASKFALEMIRAQLNANDFLKLNQSIEDITITLTNQFQFLKISKNNSYFIYLIADSTKANLTFTKAILNKQISEISSMFHAE
ncbi:hypothetical protein [Flavobacterium hydatis]|jgi:hypothetical protein|uniref:Roadblock/LAMTOR2 domain-containing protein n=1 Tax=Flavobacterium hydatis TaxID=991 RepID=A0A086A0W7_FLAHY|nr:hypothetical protein [Flavobacterium hydatis]KFF10331.1 hypothetical protein IW20_20870 [Flavobacterium hydatis]OXA92685.1 hypothetical protein B0A62_14890 [Flavobacterium hydatis]